MNRPVGYYVQEYIVSLQLNWKIEQLTSPKEKYERNRNKLEKINMELNVWFRPRGRSDLSFCPILREMQPRCNKFSPITLLDCTDSPLLPFSHRISDIPNQFECKFYTLASLKYCDAMLIGCKDSGGQPAIWIL